MPLPPQKTRVPGASLAATPPPDYDQPAGYDQPSRHDQPNPGHAPDLGARFPADDGGFAGDPDRDQSGGGSATDGPGGWAHEGYQPTGYGDMPPTGSPMVPRQRSSSDSGGAGQVSMPGQSGTQSPVEAESAAAQPVSVSASASVPLASRVMPPTDRGLRPDSMAPPQPRVYGRPAAAQSEDEGAEFDQAGTGQAGTEQASVEQQDDSRPDWSGPQRGPTPYGQPPQFGGSSPGAFGQPTSQDDPAPSPYGQAPGNAGSAPGVYGQAAGQAGSTPGTYGRPVSAQGAPAPYPGPSSFPDPAAGPVSGGTEVGQPPTATPTPYGAPGAAGAFPGAGGRPFGDPADPAHSGPGVGQTPFGPRPTPPPGFGPANGRVPGQPLDRTALGPVVPGEGQSGPPGAWSPPGEGQSGPPGAWPSPADTTQNRFDSFKPEVGPAGDKTDQPVPQVRNVRVLAAVLTASVLLLVVAFGLVYLFSGGDPKPAFNPGVGSCVKQSGDQAAPANCGDAGSFKVVAKVPDKDKCADKSQPHLVVPASDNQPEQVLCLQPATS